MNQWTIVRASGTPPRQRSLHVGIVVQDGLYIFGGYDGSNRVNDFYKFDFASSCWTVIESADTPSARDRHITVGYLNSIYIFGGYDGSNRVNDFWNLILPNPIMRHRRGQPLKVQVRLRRHDIPILGWNTMDLCTFSRDMMGTIEATFTSLISRPANGIPSMRKEAYQKPGIEPQHVHTKTKC